MTQDAAITLTSAAAGNGPLALEAVGLTKDFRLGHGATLHAVRDVNISLYKSAVVALTKSVANHCGNQGYRIRCNAILPGVVETDMIRGVIDRAPDPAAARAQFEGMAPLKRMARVDEIAALVAFLASDEAAFISGSEYIIDGATTAGMQGV